MAAENGAGGDSDTAWGSAAQNSPILELGAPPRSYAIVTNVDIVIEADIVKARNAARKFTEILAFSLIDKTRITTAVSELARNTLFHGGGGTLQLSKAEEKSRFGVRCAFVDAGPGIADIERALEEGFTTANSLGLGLPGAKRLMDEFTITSVVGEGTRIETIKWK